jgi:hypothetical protein
VKIILKLEMNFLEDEKKLTNKYGFLGQSMIGKFIIALKVAHLFQ